MAYTVQLGTTDSPSNKVVKEFNITHSPSCEIYNEEDVLNPILFLDRSTSVKNTSAINYCYISAFGRYYFCRVVHDKTRIWVHCSVDPLMSFSEEIKAMSPRIIREERGKLSYLQDSKLPILANRIVEHKLVSNAMSTSEAGLRQLVLTVL